MLAAVLIGVLVGGYLLFVRGDADEGEVLLEAAASEGPFPWTPPVVPPDAPTTLPESMPTVAAGAPDPGRPGLIAVPGDRTGIYGGSLELSVCDKSKLIGFLEQNPGQRDAFGEVLAVTDVRAYVESLTSVILGSDTRVTNHGYENGRPTPLQSVLQAGTAVLVDDRGVPRVRCQCGNPLLPPQPTTAAPTYSGQRWPGFAPDKIIVVQPTPAPVTQFTVINVATGAPVVINAGSGTPQQQPTTSRTTAAPPPPRTTVAPPPQRTQPPPPPPLRTTVAPPPQRTQPPPLPPPRTTVAPLPRTQPPTTQALPPADWSTTALAFRGQDGGQASFECPPGGSFGTVWGSGTYTDDSSVCTAGVHAGVISQQAGGVVLIVISPGVSSYEGSTSNGVTSVGYGSWPGSFQVVGGG
ncbi:LCCL domain protein [Rhodococcus sp. IEGM 248]|nr:LCCL domain protein [Rhodococcus sp. IEGM 248]